MLLQWAAEDLESAAMQLPEEDTMKIDSTAFW